MNEFLAFVKIVNKLQKKLEEKETIRISFIDFNPLSEKIGVHVSYQYADKLVNAKPNFIHNEEDLIKVIKEEEIHIRSIQDDFEFTAIVEKAMFPELYSYYLKMAREMLNV